jgi:hypothetical protein
MQQEPAQPPPSAEPNASPTPTTESAQIPSTPTPAAAPSESPQIAPKKWAGKFENPEALETAYAELQKKLGERRVESPDQLAERAGIKLEDVTTAFLTDGKIAPHHLAALDKAGIGSALAERMIQGEAAKVKFAQAQVQQAVAEVTNLAGGASQRDNILNWAASALPKDEITRLNTSLNDPTRAVSAMRELMFEHQRAVGAGKAQPLVQGMTPVASAPGFGTPNQVTQALAQVRAQGYMDEDTKRRLANTPMHILQGIQR